MKAAQKKSTDILRRGAYAAACAAAGYFLGVRLAAFLVNVWQISLSAWLPAAMMLAAAAGGALTADLIAAFLRRWCFFPSVPAGITAVLSIGFTWIFSDFLYTRAADGALTGGVRMALCTVGGGLLLAVYILCAAAAIRDRIRALLSSGFRFTRYDAVFLVISAALLNAAVIVYAKNCSTIYFWDNAGYWTVSHQLAEVWRWEGLGALLRMVFDSVLTQDYNYLIILPAILAARLFGTSRMVFLLAIANAWLLPVFVIVWAFARARCRHAYLAAASVMLVLPMLLYNVLLGFIDVGGVVMTAAAMLLVFTDRDKAYDFGRYFLVGILLAAALLLRRWYAFYALAFVIVQAVTGLAAKRSLIPTLGTLSAFAFTLLFFFQTLVSGKLLADYGSMYAAYAIGVDKDFLLFFRYYGVIGAVILAAAVIYNLIRGADRAANALALSQTALCFLLFVRVQTHGQQHLLLYTANFIFPLILALSELEKIEPKRRLSGIAAVTASLLFTLSPFLPRVQPASKEEMTSASLLPSFSWTPPTRADAMEIVDLVRRLDRYGEIGCRVGVLASSFILNDEILRNAEASLSLPRESWVPRSYFVWLPAVDQRDGWSDALLSCDVIVAADPVQLHLGMENQACVWIPAGALHAGEGFGAAFTRTEETWTLNDGVTVRIYEKARQILPEEWAALEAQFYALHPITED